VVLEGVDVSYALTADGAVVVVQGACVAAQRAKGGEWQHSD
jgi:hypothetical protein